MKFTEEGRAFLRKEAFPLGPGAAHPGERVTGWAFLTKDNDCFISVLICKDIRLSRSVIQMLCFFLEYYRPF